ncbi:hypothetical protein M9978_01675 [Sphingomonas sp. MG17]|uniref:Uncharacterized protein n=1 Tax=Sphingomonas tagetis TaxID=2949092 RepID=A0A9X2HMJ9_9SPHN|nr:hypothetical protein [Sphingomonas tagetis]MCP3729125.1 hypothetical protein [Sphingomonas tagetis]
MVEVIHLAAGEQMPEISDHEPWLIVEASDDGRFFGTGSALKPNGESVFYASLAESDISLESAIGAAREWAVKYSVPRIWVQATADRD